MTVDGVDEACVAQDGPGRPLRILVLTPRFPYPVIGGDRLRIHAICRELAKKGHRLTLLSLCESRAQAQALWEDDGVFERVERIVLSRWRSFVNVALALPGRTPLQVAYYRSAAFRARFDTLAHEHDVCVAHLIRCGEYARGAAIPTALEMTDAISMNYRRLRERGGGGLKAGVFRVEASRLEAYERRVIDDFPVVTLVSDVDRRFLTGDGAGNRVLVCSNGVDAAALRFVDRADADPVIAFIGTMNYLPNFDACRYFASEVLPLLRARIDCRFRVVGRIGEGERLALERFDGVEVTGGVDDIAVGVGNARIGVAPMRLGAGVQNKVLEYMALGLPVVASSIALEGLSARADEELFIADSAEDFASAVLTLWNDAARRRAMAAAARHYVERHHDWTAKLSPMVSAIERLSARPTLLP